jgi:DnaK suppressor protein
MTPVSKASARKAPATKPATAAVAAKAVSAKTVTTAAPAAKGTAKDATPAATNGKAPSDKAAPIKGTAKAAPKDAAPKAPAKAVPARKPLPKAGPGPYAKDAKFLDEQRELLDTERRIYVGQAADLKAEADSLAQEREPGDVQFDEESGEGGTVTVDRERDLAMAAQALVAVEEIDDASVRIDKKTYGACERCHQPIPKPRLRALPYARLCVACKSGGLSRR